MNTVKCIHSKGQALVVLLFYMIIAITLTTTAVAMGISSSMITTQEEEGGHALEVAESGAENALLRLLRNTSYTGEVLPVDTGTATVTVSGTTTKTVRSVGVIGAYSRTIQADVTYTNGVMTILSWQEV